MRFAIILATLPLVACGAGARDGAVTRKAEAGGAPATRTFAVADFTTVELKGSDDVDVRVGSGFSVRAEGPGSELEKLEIVRDGTTLRIGRTRTAGVSWSDSSRGVKVMVTMPRIAGASLAGSGDLAVDRVGGDFDASVAGSGDLSIGTLSAGHADFSIAGSGGITAKGTARTVSMSIAGSGDIDAAGLRAEIASVTIAGSGGVAATVSGTANVSILGSGDAAIGGGAKCTVSRMGSGEARCG